MKNILLIVNLLSKVMNQFLIFCKMKLGMVVIYNNNNNFSSQ
jgi:hypothetical protein